MAAADGSHILMLPVYNTQVSVKAYPGSQNLSGKQLDEALVALREAAIRFELTLSRTRADSEVTRLNDAGGAWVELSPNTLDLVDKSRAYCEASGGIFDVTMGSVTPLWNFHAGVVPVRADLDEALKHVDWHMIEVDRAAGKACLADPQARIDLGFIADTLAKVLVDHGCGCAFVNLGGNVLTVGARPDGAPWRIGVRDPKDPATLRAVVPVVGKSVVTSGLYERNFEKNGVFYHHILSPKNGMPVKTGVGGSHHHLRPLSGRRRLLHDAVRPGRGGRPRLRGGAPGPRSHHHRRPRRGARHERPRGLRAPHRQAGARIEVAAPHVASPAHRRRPCHRALPWDVDDRRRCLHARAACRGARLP